MEECIRSAIVREDLEQKGRKQMDTIVGALRQTSMVAVQNDRSGTEAA